MNSSETPRKPTDEEFLQIAKVVAGGDGIDLDTTKGQLSCASIAVFDRYCPDSPGYTGKAAVILWPAYVGMVSVVICDQAGVFFTYDTSEMLDWTAPVQE